MDKNGKSDPYCVVNYVDSVSAPKGKKHKTRAIFETLNPIWMQDLV
jgi:Ca2+-dependent lipid-binding protein